MKKIIALILTLTAAVTLASCGGGGTVGQTTDSLGGSGKPDSTNIGGQTPGKTDPADVPHDIPDSEGLEYELNETKDGYIVVGIGDCTDTEIGIPATHEGLPVTEIGKNAFNGCTGLTSITIPDSVTEIGYSAFSACAGLKSITLPNSLTKIGDTAFYFCAGLTSITIPDSVTNIGGLAFACCTGLTSITVAEGNPVYHSAGNCLIGTESKSLIAGCNTSVIPNDGSVTRINDWAFHGCTDLTSITIPDGVTAIDNSAFSNCKGLTSVTIPDNVTKIAENAFSFCTGLASITIPASVTEIGWNAFGHCDSLTDIYYAGTQEQWEELARDAEVSDTATVHYNSKG